MMARKEIEGQGTLRDIAYIVFKHKKKLLLTFCVTVACVAIVSLLMTPVYQASSKILVKFGRENTYMPAVPGGGGYMPVLVDPAREERVNAAVEMIKGQKVIEGVIQKMGVKNIYPQLVSEKAPSSMQSTLNAATRLFQKDLSVKGVRKSNLIEIKFDHNDPILAVKVVNALIDTFVEHHVTAYREPRNFDFFSEQVKLLTAKLKASESELAAFRNRHSISSLQDQKATLLKQISEIEIELAKVKADLAENRGKREALRESRGSLTAEPRLGKETDFNPYALNTIRSRLTELRLKETELLNRYSETSTLVMNVRKEIDQAEQLLAREEMTYHDKDVRSLDQNIQALKQKEAALEKTTAASQGKLNSVAAAEMRFIELERQFKIDEENYQLYVRKMEESRISDAMDTEKIANLSVVEPASTPTKPVRPKILLNMILAVVLGALLSLSVTILAERLGHNFGKAKDVEERLGVPVLASIREMEV
ncbi:MAG TPA: GumC family protein [Syntrophorhabdales bacterium]|nr:GumC family protein [Syntrophorhabdales bacterium]